MANSRKLVSKGYSESQVVWFDDFFPQDTTAGDVDLATARPGGIAVLDGADAQATQLVMADVLHGAVQLTTGNVGDTAANDASGFGTGLIWNPSIHGKIVWEVRLRHITAITDRNVWIGFTDVCDDGNLEEFWSIATVTHTSTITDGVGFIFDTGATAQTWHAVGVDTNVDTITKDTEVAPVAGTEQTFQISIYPDGKTEWWIDGRKYAEQAEAVTPNVALAGVVQANSTTTTASTVEADYALAYGNREQP